jgi:hypothetical protein
MEGMKFVNISRSYANLKIKSYAWAKIFQKFPHNFKATAKGSCKENSTMYKKVSGRSIIIKLQEGIAPLKTTSIKLNH